MITPLDPVIAQLIPLLPLRDPNTMTPESARDARSLPPALTFRRRRCGAPTRWR
jgi:hypothetical protein